MKSPHGVTVEYENAIGFSCSCWVSTGDVWSYDHMKKTTGSLTLVTKRDIAWLSDDGEKIRRTQVSWLCFPKIIQGVELDHDKYIYKHRGTSADCEKWPEFLNEDCDWEDGSAYYASRGGLYRCPIEDACEECFLPKISCDCTEVPEPFPQEMEDVKNGDLGVPLGEGLFIFLKDNALRLDSPEFIEMMVGLGWTPPKKC